MSALGVEQFPSRTSNNFFLKNFENEPLDEPKKMPPSKKLYLFKKMVRNANWWSTSNLPLSQTAKLFPFKKGFLIYILIKIKRLTLGAGPKAVCHQFTRANFNFTWSLSLLRTFYLPQIMILPDSELKLSKYQPFFPEIVKITICNR